MTYHTFIQSTQLIIFWVLIWTLGVLIWSLIRNRHDDSMDIIDHLTWAVILGPQLCTLLMPAVVVLFLIIGFSVMWMFPL